MPPIIKLWLTATCLLGSLMLISEWLPGTGVPFSYGRFVLAVSAFGGLLLIMRRWWCKTVRARLKPLVRVLSAAGTGEAALNAPAAGGDEISELADLVHRLCPEPRTEGEAGRDSAGKTTSPSPGRRLSGNLTLAADHVESIRALLEVSQTHQQPIPRAAFQNLELVSKHLREIQRQIDAAPEMHIPGVNSSEDLLAGQALTRSVPQRIPSERPISPSGN